jgi:nucleotide-binding universal stress UspA family protein
MKKLITAIDFSKCSLHALEYSINLANTVEADVEMVWVDTHHDSDSDLAVVKREHRMEIKEQFEELVERYSANLKTGELNYKIRKGKVYQEVANQAKYDDASMIITGSHGVSGYEKFWIGSNAYRIVSSAPCPVLTIRLDYAFRPVISRIILPIDSTLETRQKVPYTVRLAKFHNSTINIIAVYSTSVKAIQRKVDQYAEQTALFIHQHGIHVELNVIEAENITNAIINHAEKTDADLISIMTEQESTPANLLLGPYAQQMINNSPIPVLTTQATEIQKITTGF